VCFVFVLFLLLLANQQCGAVTAALLPPTDKASDVKVLDLPPIAIVYWFVFSSVFFFFSGFKKTGDYLVNVYECMCVCAAKTTAWQTSEPLRDSSRPTLQAKRPSSALTALGKL
jgi:hypothetical protein